MRIEILKDILTQFLYNDKSSECYEACTEDRINNMNDINNSTATAFAPGEIPNPKTTST